MEKPVLRNEFEGKNTFSDLGAAELKGRVFVRNGKGNVLTVGRGSKFSGTVEIAGDNNTVKIGKNCRFVGQILVKGSGQTVTFGNNSTTVNVYILCQEGSDVHIGRWCMFSREIEIRTTDAHSIIDRATGKRLNDAGSVKIGDHVWVGVGAIISKGAQIPSDSIVGAMSFVNKVFEEEGVVLAGVPAKVVKRGITWNRGRRPHFTSDQMDHWKNQDDQDDAESDEDDFAGSDNVGYDVTPTTGEELPGNNLFEKISRLIPRLRTK